jgi:hypothetical protein
MRFNILIIAITILFFSSSCKKELLSPVPQTAISDQVAFNTADRTAQAVNGMYSGVKVGAFYGGRYYNYQDIRGEEFINETTNGTTNLATWNYTVSSGTNEVQNLWTAAYAAINRINVVLKGVDQAPITDALKNQYKGEACFLRALVYHSLVTIYARPYSDGNGSKPGVIIYTDPQTSSGENSKARSTVAEVYNQIINDLNFAEANLPSSYSVNSMNITHAHKNAAIALKTRVYLHMGQYDKVITEANKIVSVNAPFTAPSGVPHALQANIATVFGSNGQTLENIFSFPFSSSDLPGTQNSLNQYYSPGISPATGNGDYSLNQGVTGIVSDPSWTSTDARRNLNQVISGKLWLRKWTSNSDYVPVIRYSEILLNLAEALARINGLDNRAIALLNAVRKRSDSGTTLNPASQQELIDMILRERRIELLGEGFRSRDLIRLLLTFPAKGSISPVLSTDTQYIWPIPQTELFINKSASQNPGY